MARRPIDHPNVVGSRRILIFIPSLRTFLCLSHRTLDPSVLVRSGYMGQAQDYRPLDLSLILEFSFVQEVCIIARCKTIDRFFKKRGLADQTVDPKPFHCYA